jgi:hypothetical protein
VGQPEVGQPEVGQPGVGEPGVGEPGVGEPGVGEPGVAAAGLAEAEPAEADDWGGLFGLGPPDASSAAEPAHAEEVAPSWGFTPVEPEPAAAPAPSEAPKESTGDPPTGFTLADPEAAPASAKEESTSDNFTWGSHREAQARPSRRRREVRMEFARLLEGYACFFSRDDAVFGRPYGTLMVDRHVYPYVGDAEPAYHAFLVDKIKEGFVPRSELTGELPRGVTLMPLDLEIMGRVWRSMS